uniref:Endoplasmic reticulum vesicle transporter N-terminal domain-containing protein n=1 Tax=Parascaris univalens TaxID=6257 RepID=A0A915A732_PARUN
MRMSLPGGVLRHRRPTLQEIVQRLDAFDKTADEIKEEKKTSGAIISIVCFTVIGILVFGELKTYISGDTEFEYKFTVDTAFDEQPELELDMIVATPCTNLVAQLSGTAAEGFFLLNQFKRDPTRFEFTEREQRYWDELKRVHGVTKPGGMVFKGLEKMEFVSGHVEEGLKAEAEVKQREEAIAIEKERKNNKQEDTFGGAILLIGNGINVFHILASDSQKDEGTACRVHGRVRVNKVKGDSVIITAGKGAGIDGLFAHVDGASNAGNISHRIARLHFGPWIGGLLTPLAGTEQISESGMH